LILSGDLLLCAKHLLVEAKRPSLRAHPHDCYLSRIRAANRPRRRWGRVRATLRSRLLCPRCRRRRPNWRRHKSLSNYRRTAEPPVPASARDRRLGRRRGRTSLPSFTPRFLTCLRRSYCRRVPRRLIDPPWAELARLRAGFSLGGVRVSLSGEELRNPEADPTAGPST
jgi:hypothetical protein